MNEDVENLYGEIAHELYEIINGEFDTAWIRKYLGDVQIKDLE
jgi:hypothetical protein